MAEGARWQLQDRVRLDQARQDQMVALQATTWKPLVVEQVVSERIHQSRQQTRRGAGQALQNPELTWHKAGVVLLNPQQEQMQSQQVRRPLAKANCSCTGHTAG